MAVRRSITHNSELEELDALSAPVFPLRRRSRIRRVAEPADAAENDDETERLQRRLEKKQLLAGEAEKCGFLGLDFVSKTSNPRIANGMTTCMKLSAENKINVKNAFSLEMIEFMTYMIKKRNSNLQEASTWLDVSAKIYGFRVDSLHVDTLKMTGGQEKSDSKWDSGLGTENSDPCSDSDFEGQRTRRAKKKESKQKILASAESLRASLDLISTASMMIDEPDSQTSEMLFQTTLPVHANSDLYLHPYDDVILDTVDPEMEADVNNAPVDCPRLERFGHLDLCPSFANFEFLSWSAKEKLELALESRSQTLVEDDDFQFDLEASLPADDEPGSSGMNYFEMEDNDENTEVHDTMNMQSVLQRYSEENIDGSRIVEGCTQESIKHRVNAAVTFDEEPFQAAMDKFEIVKHEPVKLDRKTMKVSWSAEKLTVPADVDYDDVQHCRYYLRPEVIKKSPLRDATNGTFLPVEVGDYDYNNNENDTMYYCSNIETEDRQADNEENCNNVADFKVDVVDFDYDNNNNNENDTRNCCSNIEIEDHQGDNENCINGAELEEYVAVATHSFTGDNLVEAPKMPNRISIPFSERAKKIDMRDLKRAMWEDLTSTDGDKENVDVVETSGDSNADKVNGRKKFSDLVKNLPKRLSKSNAEALSVPIAFVTLLHLANENTLQIDSSDDRIDLHIRQG